MRLLALTDVNDGKTVEFVVVEKIQHIQPFHQVVESRGPEERIARPKTFLQKLFNLDSSYEYSQSVEKRTLTGSTVYMDNGHGTHVLETPENIAGMLTEGNFLTVETVEKKD